MPPRGQRRSSSSASKAAAVRECSSGGAYQLGLMETLRQLPAGCLQTNIWAHLSHDDLQAFRLVSKEAVDVLHSSVATMHLRPLCWCLDDDKAPAGLPAAALSAKMGAYRACTEVHIDLTAASHNQHTFLADEAGQNRAMHKLVTALCMATAQLQSLPVTRCTVCTPVLEPPQLYSMQLYSMRLTAPLAMAFKRLASIDIAASAGDGELLYPLCGLASLTSLTFRNHNGLTAAPLAHVVAAAAQLTQLRALELECPQVGEEDGVMPGGAVRRGPGATGGRWCWV